MQCNEIRFGDYLDVTCEVSLCDGVASSKVRESVMLHNDIPRYHDFRALSSDMLRLLASRAYSDFTIVVGDHAFAVHTAVLVARSPVFSKMLQHDMVEKETRRVVIRDVRPVIVQLMLMYMYTGTVRGLEFNEAIDLYEAADKYFVDVLKKRCAHLLLSIAKEDNLCLLFDLADKHSDADLKNRVYEIIKIMDKI
ncbi:protein roadkill [Caerostris darwini]|uniref:Protein roadkill n=1 Tax=Caerostris darwini TaxID=1538125 RepID=A0AAV4Q6L9_9ARAC|nr:protein roadkill [Caerostris darwini]